MSLMHTLLSLSIFCWFLCFFLSSLCLCVFHILMVCYLFCLSYSEQLELSFLFWPRAFVFVSWFTSMLCICFKFKGKICCFLCLYFYNLWFSVYDYLLLFLFHDSHNLCSAHASNLKVGFCYIFHILSFDFFTSCF